MAGSIADLEGPKELYNSDHVLLHKHGVFLFASVFANNYSRYGTFSSRISSLIGTTISCIIYGCYFFGLVVGPASKSELFRMFLCPPIRLRICICCLRGLFRLWYLVALCSNLSCSY